MALQIKLRVKLLSIMLISINVIILQGCITDFDSEKINIKQTNTTIYLKHFRRGLNFDEVSISTRKTRVSNKKMDYIFPSIDEIIFLKISHDTVYVLCSTKAMIPDDFRSCVKIVQKEYTNIEYYNLIKTYKQKGFMKFPK